MKRNIWPFLCVAEAIVIVCCVLILCLPNINVKASNANLQEYLEYTEENNYFPEAGYIPDAKTAKKVGSAIIDNFTGNTGLWISGVTVEYDETNRLWKVTKSYLMKNGAFVILEQDSGKVVKALFTK